MDDTAERICDLMAYHKELEQEELFLTSLLCKIDKQIHALQVEQLHLLNTRNQSDLNPVNYKNMVITGNVEEPSKRRNDKDSSLENGQELDLRPIKKYSEEYEEDEDLDDKEEGEFPDNSADFDYL